MKAEIRNKEPQIGFFVVVDWFGTWTGNNALTCTVNERPIFIQVTRLEDIKNDKKKS